MQDEQELNFPEMILSVVVEVACEGEKKTFNYVFQLNKILLLHYKPNVTPSITLLTILKSTLEVHYILRLLYILYAMVKGCNRHLKWHNYHNRVMVFYIIKNI